MTDAVKVNKRRLWQVLFTVFSIALLAVILRPIMTEAAAYTWDGGGADNNWSTCANWTTDFCPGASDTATFNGTSTKDVTIDGGFGGTVTSITIASGYTGTITMARSLTVSTSFSQATGTFTAANQSFDMNGTFTLSGGIFTASSGSTTLAGAMTVSGSPTFNANSGTWTFDGTTTATLSCNNITFNLVTFNHDTNAGKTVSSNCTLPLGNNPSTGASTTQDLTINGTLTGTGTLTIGAKNSANLLTLNSGGSLSGFTGLDAGSVTIAGTYDFSTYTTLFAVSSPYSQTSGTVTLPNGADFNNTFTVSSGATLNASSGITNFAGNFTLDAGSIFNHNNGTLDFDGANAGLLTCNGASIYNATFTHTSNFTKTIGTTCTVPLGNNPTIGSDGTADVTVNGTLSGTGTLSHGTKASGNLLTLSSTGALSGFSGLGPGSLTVTGGTYDFGAYSALVFPGAYSQTAGTVTIPSGSDFNSTFSVSSGATFNAPSGTATFASTFTLAAGSIFNANSGTITFDGAVTATITCNSAVFNLVTFAHSSNFTKTVSSGCTLPLGNNPTVGSGSFPDIIVGGTLSGTGTLTIGGKAAQNTLIINSGGSLSGFSALDAGTVSLAAGTHNFGSLTTFATRADFSLVSGVIFTAPSGTLSLYEDFTVNAGATFNANGGTVVFTDPGYNSAIINCNNVTFNLVVFDNSQPRTFNNCAMQIADSTVDVSSTQIVLGTNSSITGGGNTYLHGMRLTINQGSSISGFSELLIAEIELKDNASLDISAMDYVYITNNLTMRTGSSLTQGTAELEIGSIGMSDGGASLIGGSGPMLFHNDVDIVGSADVLTLTSGMAKFEGNLELGGATSIDANGGVVEFTDDGFGGAYTVACNGAVFNEVTFTRDIGTLTIADTCEFLLGNNPSITVGPDFRLYGQLTGTGTLTVIGSLSPRGSSVDLSGFTGLQTDDLFIGVAGTATSLNLGAFNTVDVDGDFSVAADGVFTATSANMTVAGDFSVDDAGTFNHNNGTVILDGSDQTINGTTFYNLNKTVATAATLTMSAGRTVTIQGTLTLKDASGQLLSIVSSDPGVTQWGINASGDTEIRYVSVTDSNNVGSAITALDSENGGNNINWLFVDTSIDSDPEEEATQTDDSTIKAITDDEVVTYYEESTDSTNDDDKSDNETDDYRDDGLSDFGAATTDQIKSPVTTSENKLPAIVVRIALGGLVALIVFVLVRLFVRPGAPPLE